MITIINWVLLLSILVILVAHIYLALRSKSAYARYIILAYSAGIAFYLFLPCAMKMTFGNNIIHLPFSESLWAGDELLTKIMLMILVCVGISFLTYIAISSAMMTSDQKKVPIPRNSGYINHSLNRTLFTLVWVVSLVLVLQASSSGVIATGERSQGLSIFLLMVVNTLLPILLAFSLDGVKTKRAVVVLVLAVITILIVNAFFVSGSRRDAAFFFIFVALPVWIYTGVLKRATAIILIVPTICIIIVYGMIRKRLHESTSFHDAVLSYESTDSWEHFENMLLNADFAVVFDSFVGVIKRVPDEVGYLYGDTLLKFLYAPIPRTLWPDKPESISVVVAKRIYEVGEAPVSFNPTIVGEFYFNFGWMGVGSGGVLLGILLTVVTIFGRKMEFKHRLSYLVVTGYVSMTMFNLWRGYTFEVIFALAVFLGVFFSLEFILKRSKFILKRST